MKHLKFNETFFCMSDSIKQNLIIYRTVSQWKVKYFENFDIWYSLADILGQSEWEWFSLWLGLVNRSDLVKCMTV